MRPLEGIDLGELANEAKAERLAEQKGSVKKKIAMILNQSGEVVGSIRHLENQIVKAKERLGKLQTKLLQIEKGDWSVLEDDKEKKEDGGEGGAEGGRASVPGPVQGGGSAR